MRAADDGWAARFSAFFAAWSLFRFGGESPLQPIAANASRWTNLYDEGTPLNNCTPCPHTRTSASINDFWVQRVRSRFCFSFFMARYATAAQTLSNFHRRNFSAPQMRYEKKSVEPCNPSPLSRLPVILVRQSFERSIGCG